MLRRFIAPSLAALLLAGCATPQADTQIKSVPRASGQVFEGAVSAADPRAQAAGEEILAQGGSATDAAIAVMLALTVVEPQSSGIGGGGFYVRGAPDGTVETIDGREKAPAAATPDWFYIDGELPGFRESVASGLSVGVPGNIALAAQAFERHGTLDWATLFEPAIRLARDGFEVNPRLNSMLTDSAGQAGRTEAARAVFYDTSGAALPVGATVRNEALARTLDAIAKAGPEAFYRGPIAGDIARTVAADTPRPQAMTLADIEAYEAKERDAICRPYRAYRVCTMGPPTSGGIAVLQILGMLERFDLRSMGVENPQTWQLFLEAQRLAYADRELYAADSDFVDVPVEGLLDDAYLASRSVLILLGKAAATVDPGRPQGAPMALADGDEPEERGTSHFAVVDGSGTMISYTSTIESAFGSGLFVSGFFLNNELTDFSRSPEIDGVPVANRVEGGKRPRSSMSPVIVYDPSGRPFMAVGAAGGSTIPVQTTRSIVGVIDFGLGATEALGLPFTMASGDRLLLEEGTWLADAADTFRAYGYQNVAVRSAPLKAGMVLRTADGWISARDPRLEAMLILP